MPEEILGREVELATLAEFHRSIARGPAVAVLRGEQGAGKTTLWRRAVADAAGHGLRILAARPAEAESTYAFSTVADLLEHARDEVQSIPDDRRRALEVAVRMADAPAEEPDPQALAVAFRSVLTAFGTQPLLIAIDDEQWIDSGSLRALDYALRRVHDEPIGVLLAVRSPATSRIAAGVAGSLPPHRLLDLAVGPLSLGATHRLIRTVSGHDLARTVARAIHEASGGNPLHVVEIARGMAAVDPPPAPGEPIPLPPDLASLVRERVTSLRGPTRDVLVVCAAMSRPTSSRVEAMFAPSSDSAPGSAAPDVEHALAEAGAAGIVEFVGDRIRFTHPTLPAALLAALPPATRRSVHARLAEHAPDPEQRARHRALSAAGPDEAVAAELAAAAGEARRRGAVDAAVELMELARSLTAPDRIDVATSRGVKAAEWLFDLGDTAGAVRILESALADAPPGEERAEALLLLGTVTYFERGSRPGYQIIERALHEPGLSDRTHGRIHARAAWINDFDLRAALRHATEAVSLLDEQQDPGLLSFALFQLFQMTVWIGAPPDTGVLARALELERTQSDWEESSVPMQWAKQNDRFDDARAWLEAKVRYNQALGNENYPDILLQFSELECWSGSLAEAERLAAEARLLVERTEQAAMEPVVLYTEALVHAHQGRLEQARTEAGTTLSMAEAMDDAWVTALALTVLGFVELSAERATAAFQLLTRARSILDDMGAGDPGRFRFHADHVEAAVLNGDVDRAEALTAWLVERGQAVPRPWIAALGARCQGLVRAAQGDLRAAEESFDHALVEHDALAMPLERARTLLALGTVRRRTGRRRDAQGALAEAASITRAIGARAWSERIARETARLGLRRSAGEGLTPSELRVAELTASGLTNRQVAERLFVSVKTVEANLARIYRKLDIRSRAELGSRMASGQGQTGN